MLEQLSDQIRGCYESAAEAKAQADATNDPALKAEFLKVERRWLRLAESFRFTESLEDFTTANLERRRRFDERLRANMGSSPGVSLPGSAEQILWSIVENSDDAIITKSLDGIISSWNKSAERIFGYTAEEAVGKSITILIPPDRNDEEPEILARIRRGERIDHYETIRQRKDGILLNISLTVSPIKNAQGEIVGASKIARDITEGKRRDEHFAILAREAEHRVKNVLATVQATVNLSQSKTLRGLKGVIEGRILALANVHALFVESRWKGAELSSLVRRQLAPYLQDNARAHIDGPQVLLEPNTAQTIAVILYELATNAAKYGALSRAKGRVEVKWSLALYDKLRLTWTEKKGPVVKKPTRRGFGTHVMERMIREQHKGDLRLDWRTEGLVCEIVLRTS
ncbi:MAG: PAS domain S-box protein [Xanthobacteraceae bacterium]